MSGFSYKSYVFVDKDPIIDEVRTMYQDAGVNYQWIADNSGVTKSTLSNWFSGKTKKPQAATINAVARALGYKLGFVRLDVLKPVVKFDPPMSQPKLSVRHVGAMSKYRRAKHG